MGKVRYLGQGIRIFSKDSDNEYAMIDSTIVRAHQHSAGKKKMIQDKQLAVAMVD